MAQVSLKGVVKRYDKQATVIQGIDLEIRDGEFIVFVGPSGCGKSTLLRMIAGLEDISEGELLIGGQRANEIPPAQRGLAMVFQSYALYPHLSVYDNMAFALNIAGTKKDQVRTIVEQAADVLQIRHLLERKPKDLSGGQRQRVAIGRAIVRKPQLFLFDEPLSNLDASLRVQMRIEISRLHQKLKTTMIYVTHDQVEAMTLGQRIVVFNSGGIEQIGTPLELYERPANMFVAGFLGTPKMNFLTAKVVHLDQHELRLHVAGGNLLRFPRALLKQEMQFATGETLTIASRAEHLRLHSTGESLENTVSASVDLIEHLGDASVLYAKLPEQDNLIAVKLTPQHARQQRGENLMFSLAPEHSHVFDSSGRNCRCFAEHRYA